MPVRRSVAAALAYFGLVFALGFVLGTVRTLLLAPRVGPTVAVAIELPFMIAASWFACGWCLRRFAVPRASGDRIAMGAIAFGLLMLGELAVSVMLAGRGVAAHFALYALGEHQLGLAGQIVFALLPLLRRATPGPADGPSRSRP
jgi:hypothetical protein